ncbi:hypothetical protein UUU_15750 [Klebsiella pneumoniae subsp. pneumoniae DSM 30104 = JCM 1662 = NBRC 14940]|nr:hypothetical protein UUU_15750 [Klebsiella pneumoniae subsp. pneumoniae DSM 30104 = JCM 1662 = NBRC 14940]
MILIHQLAMLPGIQFALIHHHQIFRRHLMLYHDKVNPHAGSLLVKAFIKGLITLIFLRHTVTDKAVTVFR